MSRAGTGRSGGGEAGSRPAGPASPLRAVLTELSAGVHTLDEVARRTQLDREVVAAAVEHLVRLGRVSATTLSTACPDAGCGTCGATGCGARGRPATSGRRPVLVALSTRPPRPPGAGRLPEDQPR